MKKRFLSMICILSICLGLLPVSAFAEPVDNGTAAVNSPQAENVEPPEGTVVWITGCLLYTSFTSGIYKTPAFAKCNYFFHCNFRTIHFQSLPFIITKAHRAVT